MKKHIVTSVLYTVITAVLLGIGYPLVVTGLARVLFPKQANGSLIEKNGVVVGSHLIGQAFDGPGYFWSRQSAAGAGNGYDASSSGGSNYAPTNAALKTRVAGTVATLNPKGTDAPVPIDLANGVGLGAGPGHYSGGGLLPGRARGDGAAPERGRGAGLGGRARDAAAVRPSGRAASECAGAESGSGRDGPGG